MNIRRHVPIGPMTTYRVGGAAALFLAIDNEEDLLAAVALVRAEHAAVLVVGKGSNLLVADAGFDGVAVMLGDGFGEVVIDGTTVAAGGAVSLPVVARRTAAAGLTGFEWAVGVPGSIGGAVRMNAGGHGSDMAATLTGVRVVDLASGEDEWMAASALDLAYRHSAIGASQVVVRAELALERGDAASAEATIASIVRWRRENQPGGQNAGSVFANPPDDSAGRLIDAAGCKGLRIGTAAVSDKHANFFIADDGGRADDVFALMREVRRRVHDAHGIWLEAETRLVGFTNPRREVES
ncbi:MAG TPA: UDP-N-acetylmuramate dehydrogenase [Acidimicrobiales bacterium]|nr:UDP-N-acetylmuramate dehydrogenase [Acidimicrobiales bacterium]